MHKLESIAEQIRKNFDARTIARDQALAKGVNTYQGAITYPSVAEAFGLDYSPLDGLI